MKYLLLVLGSALVAISVPPELETWQFLGIAAGLMVIAIGCCNYDR